MNLFRSIGMSGLIISREDLYTHLLSRISSNEIMVQEDGNAITLTPVRDKRTAFSELVGMLAGSGVSTEAYCRQKQLDKELE
jgi:hypothetical protein